MFFFEKKNQKTFIRCCRRPIKRHTHLNLQKSFASFLQKRRPCLLLGLIASLPLPLPAQPVPVAIAVEQPVYAGLPVWLDVDVQDACLEARYPASDNFAWFGPNENEAQVSHNGKPAPPANYQGGGVAFNGLVSSVPCPGSHPSGPASDHRFPLHLRTAFDDPGTYAVRWVVKTWMHPGVVSGASAWLTFQVQPSTPARREAWLQSMLSHMPSDGRALRSDYIPSLLAAWQDPRVTARLIDLLCSPDPLTGRAAEGAMQHPIGDAGIAYLSDRIRAGCLTEAVATFMSLHAQEFSAHRAGLIHAIAWRLRPVTNAGAAPAIHALQWLRLEDTHDALRQWADAAVLAIGPQILESDDAIKLRWAQYFFQKSMAQETRVVFHSLASQHGAVMQQAWIVLCANAEMVDFKFLAARLVALSYDSRGDEFPGAAEFARGYGPRAIPALRAVMRHASAWEVRDNAAIALSGLHQQDGTQAVIAALQSHRESGYVLSDMPELPVPYGPNRADAAVKYLQHDLQVGGVATKFRRQ